MKITIERLENLIKTAIASDADIAEVQDLKDHLDDLKSGRLLMSQPDIAYEKVNADGTKVRGFSTAPVSPEDDDDFEGVTFRKISLNN